jgi:AbiU2
MTAPKADRDALFASWRERLTKIQQQLYLGFLQQKLWTEMREEIPRRRPTADATFLVSYAQLYVAGQMLLVRRLADDDESTHSLASLIQAIKKNPDVMTRTRYADRWAQHPDLGVADAGREEWLRAFADPADPERINRQLLEDDLDRLATELEHLVAWANKTIAHLDPIAPTRVPLYVEIRHALDLLAEITGHYELLLEQATTADWTPFIQGDWQGPFRPALFPLDPQVWAFPPPDGFT